MHRHLPLVLAVALGLATGARADEPRVAALGFLRMPGAEGCMTPRDLATGVEARLSRRAFVAPADAELFVQGRIEPREGGGFRVVLAMTEADGTEIGTRELEEEGADCRALDDSVVLVVSAMIDPDAALRASAVPATEPAAVRAEPPRTEAARTLARPQRDCPDVEAQGTPARWRAGAWIGGVGAIGVLPGIALGGSVHVDLTPPGFVAIALGAAAFATSEATLRDGSGADLSLAWGEAALCPELYATGTSWLRGCAGAQVGAIRSQGFGFDRDLDAEGLVVNGVLRARLGVRVVGPLALTASAAVGVPFVRRRFEAREATGETREVFRMAPAIGLLEVGLGGDFF